MTITVVSTNPTNGASHIILNTAINIVLQSTNTFTVSSITASIRNIPAIAGGLFQSGYTGAITVTGTAPNQQVSITISQNASFNSYELVSTTVSATDLDSTNFSYTFSFYTKDIVAPVFAELTPAPGSSRNPTNTPIFFQAQDNTGSGVQLNSINVTIDSQNAILNGIFETGFSGHITQVGGSVDVFIQQIQPFTSGQSVVVTASVSNEDQTTTLLVNGNPYQFNIIAITPPIFSSLIPASGAMSISESTTVALTVTDVNANAQGIPQSSINVSINGVRAVINGVAQLSFASTQFIPSGSSIIVIITPHELFDSASTVRVSASAQDSEGNPASIHYTFQVRDFAAPIITNFLPSINEIDVIPSTHIEFTIQEEPDGYGVDFSSLNIVIDGYAVYNSPFDGYTIAQDGYEIFMQPIVRDFYGNLLYPGFVTEIAQDGYSYDVTIQPQTSFGSESLVFVNASVADLGGHLAVVTYSFTTADVTSIITTAFPNTGTYKTFIDGYGLQYGFDYLTKTGVTLTTNMPNTITYYTIDGTLPSIDRYGRVLGTTRVYTQPILIQREGLNVVKYFSSDLAFNDEPVRQEVYMIKLLPPEIRQYKEVLIIADIPLPTQIIPLDNTSGGVLGAGTNGADIFAINDNVYILDNLHPPILTQVLSVNATASPPFIIVADKVSGFRVSQNARVQLLSASINPAIAIPFNTATPPEYMYIGSDGDGYQQADAVLESFRILNIASSDADILNDYTLLSSNIPFYNQTQAVTLPSTFTTAQVLRSNMPNNTLVLLNFNASIDNAPRAGILVNNSVPIIDPTLASNRVNVTVQVPAGQFIDRELLITVLQNFAPVDLQIQVTFVEV